VDDVSSYDSFITEASNKYGVDEKLIKAVIQAESGGNAKAHSSAGAGGLMQLMPATAKSLGVSNVFDPKQNIEGGTKYLSQMLKANNGDVALALASYNAGLGNVRKYGGIPPFKETQNYVNKILASYKGSGSSGVTRSWDETGTPTTTENTSVAEKIFSGAVIVLTVAVLGIAGIYFFMTAFPATKNIPGLKGVL
jgi:hypothetical protein